MAKLTLTDGTIFEGTTEELIALTEQFSGKVADPVAGNITHNGVEYTLVNRKAQEGDVISVSHENGYCFKPRKIYGPCFETNSGDLSVNADSSTGYEPFEVAKVYNDYYGRTTETVHVYEPKAETLKVGDYAVVSGRSETKNFVTHSFEIGEVIKVTAWRFGGVIRGEKLDGTDHDFLNRKDLRKATDAEVAEAKASAERNAVFTQVGRKPNEYREGDIVRYIGDASVNGMYADVVSDTFEGITRIEFHRKATLGKCSEKHDTLEPIVFVESRLDLRK